MSWKALAGIVSWESFLPETKDRINMVVESFSRVFYTEVTKTFAQEIGAEGFRWRTATFGNPPCWNCEKFDYMHTGKTYKWGQFMPKLPRHPNCRCEWDIVLKDGTVV